MNTSQASAQPVLDRFSKRNKWYYDEIQDQIKPNSRKLLEEYSHIPASEIDAHIYKLRDILWSHGPYPCIGKFLFLTLNLSSHPYYHQILTLLSSPTNNFLSLGTCVATDLRSLHHTHSIPASQLFGTDINPHFLTTSYTLFNDTPKSFPATLVATDIFSSSLFDNGFLGWEGKFAVVHAALFLHLFNWEEQVRVCEVVVRLLKREKGVMFVGEGVGLLGGSGREDRRFLHDEGSFGRLWKEVENRTNTEGEWNVECVLKVRDGKYGKGAFFEGEGIGWFTFSVVMT